MKVSVIIPVYNSSKTIKRCLDSVLEQTYNNWEAIVINDGSNDNSFKIMKEYAKKDFRFRIFSHENQGPGLTRNKGLDEVKGDFIVFLDSDDYIDKQYFQEIINCANKEQSDVIFIDVVQEKPNGTIIREEIMSKYMNTEKDIIIKHQMTGKLPWGGCRKAVKADFIKKHKFRYSNDEVGEEAIFSFNVLYYSQKVSFIPKPYYHYVNYPESQSKKGDLDPWGMICKNLKNYLIANGLFEKYKKTINSFGYTACIVSIQRISKRYKFIEAIKLSQKAINNFKSEYGFNMNKESIDRRAVLMLPFAKTNMVVVIVLIAKIKALLKI